MFVGEKESIGVLVLNVSNPAQRDVESVTCTLSLGSLELREPKIIGLQPGAYSQIAKEGGVFEVDIPYLNPEEAFSVQLLVASKKPEFRIPKPIVRAKGIVGVDRATRPKQTPFEDILILVVPPAFTAALVGVTIIFRSRMQRIFFTKKHSDDQRDIVAFVQEMHGFHKEAQWARSSARHLTYWSEADRLTELVLRDADSERIRKAIKCLEYLLDYADIDEGSQLLIHFDLARLAIAVRTRRPAASILLLLSTIGMELLRSELNWTRGWRFSRRICRRTHKYLSDKCVPLQSLHFL